MPKDRGEYELNNERILKGLEQAILNYDIEDAKKVAKEALEAGIDPLVAIEEGAAKGIRKVGEKFEKGDCFLPHLVMASDAMAGAIKVLETAIPKEKIKSTKLGVVVLGTVEGDIHDIGKNIVGSMLRAARFEVHDVGKDVTAEQLIIKAQEVNADIIAASSLMSTTKPAQRELIEELTRLDLREKFKVMVGGGTVTSEWAEEIGADGYGKDASEAVKIAKMLLGETD